MSDQESFQPIRMKAEGLAGQLRPVVLLKAAQFLGIAVSGILIPRWMGPDLFGRFVVLFSLIMLWRTTCNIGGRYIFGRFVPLYVSRGDSERVRAVFMHVLSTRAAIALMGAPLLFWILSRLLPDASTTTLVAGAFTYAIALIAGPMFGVQFGLNRLGLSLTNDPMRRFLLLILLLALGGTTSLERASLALLTAQILVLIFGLVLAREFFTLHRSAFDLATLWKHVRFGIVVYFASLLVRIPWRLGETAMALNEIDSAKIAYFGVAVTAAGAVAGLIASATTLLIPSLSTFQAAGDLRARDRTLGLALKYLLVAGGLFAFLVIGTAPYLIEVLLGKSYIGALPSLLILTIGIIVLPLRGAALALAVVTGEVRLNVQLGLIAVLVFGLAAYLLIPRLESSGAAAALTISILATAVVGAFQIRRTRILTHARIGRLALASTAAALALRYGGLSLQMAVLSTSVYLAILSVSGVVRLGELRSLASSLISPPR